ncbi:MAG: L-serine ammonia-lyase, iron-sulfur-dependent subunit beta [Atopobiaceae bacterium]|jgi:L-serine dehydratase|nr:L-serine ammonia-lyase, iron-sulfur-dependent subunit beta [Atopobiaceae bacterium]MCH4119856.1 L-serine ammonia-lyase, iron-sulfur-dependent subunit beta [Atopobiaceae bacterium]MCI1317734.1 L-serine ammonia-lyase, iron-sulfur-dependent subunit beta [Atopobiaceae bacterium]MCI1389137.1 L-serine ammonia-lyase, iron-sulfur-dependent subunit beta [Atopobiaceae bacterium]MCI1432852.1 L-serine ammonia-lyase, iron-sulfur-dependent subunit beta [Atopobiaceae bacterium]
MMTTSAFEILGPIMVGPSSSHTAGALRIALVARSLGPAPLARVRFTLYNSFARTYHGHGTDRALVAGVIGLAPDDVRVRDSFEMAREQGLDFSFETSDEGTGLHPNTVTIAMEGVDGTAMSVTGESLGGGRIRISSVDGIPVELTGDYPTLLVAHRDRPGVLAALTSGLSAAGVNIATMRTFRESRGGRAYTVFELDEGVGDELLGYLRLAPGIALANLVDIPGSATVAPDGTICDGFDTGAQLLALCEASGLTIGQTMRRREQELSPEADVDAAMARVLEAMREETAAAIRDPKPSLGGLIGGQARAVAEGAPRLAGALMGETLTRAVAAAMAVIERSATMGVIVAAPTAGSAGVVPGSVLAVADAVGADDERIALALWNACAVGAIVARCASVSGAEGGCQAEVGTAAAMAASAVAELMGADPATCLSAASTAISNLLGLVCDPVRGLVEHPCQDRNAIGVADAVSAAQLALSGVLDPLPFDEVVGAMRSVGLSIPATLRETALGGLAAAPSACGACNRCEGR